MIPDSSFLLVVKSQWRVIEEGIKVELGQRPSASVDYHVFYFSLWLSAWD